MTSDYIPLINALRNHKQLNSTSFHVPGHKNGLFFHSSILEDFQNVLAYDVTELDGLDDLHAPSGAILEAQKQAARFYEVDETFFLVGGSTVGNIAMIYGSFERGDYVFVQRNSHKSIFHALQIAGLIPILLPSEIDNETGLAVGITEQTIYKAIQMYPEAKGVVLTYPNYYGVSLNLEATIACAKKHNLLVLVDEAHAAHFTIGSPFPPSTLKQGADVVVQSAHKMLPALTMSSFLHLNYKQIGPIRHNIKEALAMFQSSSPSYLLLASLDAARAYTEELSKEEMHEIIAGVQAFKEELATIKQLEVINWPERYHCDPLKVTIRTKTNLSGFELQSLFTNNHFFPELADEKHVLLVFGLGKMPISTNMVSSLRKSLEGYEVVEQGNEQVPAITPTIQLLELHGAEVRQAKKKKVLLEHATGCVAAEAIILILQVFLLF